MNDTLLCIDNTGVEFKLVLWRLYKVEKVYKNSVLVLDEWGNYSRYGSSRFKLVSKGE